ncbi:MAG: 5-deoxy-glucuronate isomerase [Planctomycetes bacterium]|nr:5-deoxy-glucuronate isomerase [Planctomycetota bacterium]MCB9885094.1 5-deoxy-glucuronate isomerase [Planctomycetota bacterium]
MNALAAHDDGDRTTFAVGGRWFTELRLWRPRGEARYVTGDAESAAVLLRGTFDLVGGGTAWPARGARTTEFEGRPMAVFLPPRTEFGAHHGDGEILVVAARQPAAEPEPEGRAALSRKPLLPLAGSGKAFDPGTGEWRPAETFPTSAESLPPRRMQRLPVGDVTVERVFAPDYKAATLSLDEAVLPAGASLDLRAIPGRPLADEVLLFVRPRGTAQVRGGEQVLDVAQDTALLVAAGEELAVTALGDMAYVVIAYAGK